MLIVEKILVFMLVMSVLDVIKECFTFVIAIYKETKMDITDKRLWMLAVSISYIFTIIITGFNVW